MGNNDLFDLEVQDERMSNESRVRVGKSGWRHQLGRVRRAVGRRLRGVKAHLPNEVFPDDVYLDSYPRSGNTWARLLVGNYITGGNCTRDSVPEIVPDIHWGDRSVCDDLARPRFIKSHVPYVPEYPRVVYISRDGRDVAVSYYYYYMRLERIDEDTPFSGFLREFNRGRVMFGSWSEHVDSWLDSGLEDLLVVRYEDLKSDAKNELLRIVRFAGLPADEELADLAVEKSTFETWQSSEKRAGDTAGARLHARSGAAGQYQDLFSPEELTEFMAIHGKPMKRLGYVE